MRLFQTAVIIEAAHLPELPHRSRLCSMHAIFFTLHAPNKLTSYSGTAKAQTMNDLIYGP